MAVGLLMVILFSSNAQAASELEVADIFEYKYSAWDVGNSVEGSITMELTQIADGVVTYKLTALSDDANLKALYDGKTAFGYNVCPGGADCNYINLDINAKVLLAVMIFNGSLWVSPLELELTFSSNLTKYSITWGEDYILKYFELSTKKYGFKIELQTSVPGYPIVFLAVCSMAGIIFLLKKRR